MFVEIELTTAAAEVATIAAAEAASLTTGALTARTVATTKAVAATTGAITAAEATAVQSLTKLVPFGITAGRAATRATETATTAQVISTSLGIGRPIAGAAAATT